MLTGFLKSWDMYEACSLDILTIIKGYYCSQERSPAMGIVHHLDNSKQTNTDCEHCQRHFGNDKTFLE